MKLRLYRRQGVSEYWLVEPEEEAVEAWWFEGSEAEGEAVHERFTDCLPVRIRGEEVGGIDLAGVFTRGA